MTKITDISCVIIAKNAQETLGATLDSLKDFDDVVVYSNNSNDNTEIIAKSYPNVQLIQGEFLGFGPTKNAASKYAKHEWILSLDADEVLSLEFVQQLLHVSLDNANVYAIKRINFYKSTQIKHCWGDDIIVRLYNKNVTSFTNSKVHEKIVDEGLHVRTLDGDVQHFPYASISDFIVKLDRYSTIFAQDNVGKKSSSPIKAFFNGLFSFIKTYFIKKGFLDGYAGLVIAFSHMATNFYKYIKLYELNKEQN